MPTEVEVVPNGKRVVLIRYVDGKPSGPGDRIDPLSKTARTRAARELGVDESQLARWIADGAGRYPLAGRVVVDPDVFVVRGITEANADGVEHADWRAAIKDTPVDKVMVWSDPAALCCLDVDYHGVHAPDRSWLEGVVLARVAPRPRLWHFSRSGGLHLFYEAADPFTADELAAVAALRFRTIDPTAGVELKRQVRGPGAEPVFESAAQDTTGVLSEWLGVSTFDPAGVAEWLSDHGMEMGARYDHDKCPIHSSADDGGKRQPVIVREDGVFCFLCEGKGFSLGSRRPGYAPWAAVLGSPSSGDVGNMIRNLCPWGHARYVLTEKYDLTEALARKAYGAALKAYHHGRPSAGHIPAVFCRDLEDISRVGNNWMDIAKSYTYPKDIQPLLARMPACLSADGKPILSTVVEMAQGKDHTNRGFPSIALAHGYRFTKTYMRAEDRTVVTVDNPVLKAAGDKYLPRYEKPMTEERAWGVLEQLMPGLDRALVKVTLCAIGTAQETLLGMTPLVFVTGASGAAKTTTVKVGAAVAGVKSWDVVYDADTTRFRAGIKTAAENTPVVMVNEILKDAERGNGRSRLSPKQALDPVLNLTPTAASHMLFRGTEQMGRLPAIFMTEPLLPLHLKDEKQLARRLRHYRVHGEKKVWRQTLTAANLSPDTMEKLRLVSSEVAAACNTILAAVTDEFFSAPVPFDVMADSLGVKTVDDSDDFEDHRPYLRELFRQVCLAPDITNERLQKMYSNGYKRVSRSDGADADMLVTLYTMFADGTGTDWVHSRKLSEKDWSGVIDSEHPVHLDMKTDGVSVFLRFRVGTLKKPALVNQQIVDPSGWTEDV
jgi:hypothetical protein